MRVRAIAWLVAAALTAGCARTEHYQLVVEPWGFTDEQVETVLQAARDWEDVVPVRFDASVGDCPRVPWNTVCVRATTSIGDGRSDGEGETVRQDALDYSAEVWIDESTAPEHLEQVAAHELGHAQGLAHHARGTLMYGLTVGGAPKPTDDDVAQWWHYR